MNSIIEIAKKHRRNYITPEDVSEALKLSRFSSQRVRLEVLEVLAKQTEYGAKDSSLCALIGKIMVNKSRKWGKMDKNGVVEHIRGDNGKVLA